MLWLGMTENVSAWLSTNPTASSDKLVVSAAHAVAALYENGVNKTGNSRAGTRTGQVRSSLLMRGYTGRMVNTKLPSSKASSGASRAEVSSPDVDDGEDDDDDGAPSLRNTAELDSDFDSDADSVSESKEISRIRYSTPG